jgi:hypothetical protein
MTKVIGADRVGGVLYLIIIAIGALGEAAPERRSREGLTDANCHTLGSERIGG